ncbi:nuclear transport factor 2 family protein [Mycobacterium deserti]|uniref:Nuclear transport factor 2 family protein n=1 Tax=Mycobacterium deserti TaxID=2978347 RepID=A0ABT2MIZ5_9MYCO|nr:nuclear transport factor 2 family protein [Mycobacterium deserti]MCT7661375.1 nuclear transport factor 2 family protein [Mycobacterium deserti]
MVDVATLADIEAIKQLKARYCRYLDAKDWTAWRNLLADDFESEIAGAGGRQTVGADAFVAYTRATIGRPSQVTVHHVHAPEITVTSAFTATGVWALNDVVRLVPAVTLHGYGHYHETYIKGDGQWRITSSRLTRLREDVATPLVPGALATRLRVAAARLARRTSPIKDQAQQKRLT